jgi:spermidine synthase
MRARTAAVVLLFFVSGTSGLAFEVVWLRYLTLYIGYTTFAASLVVSAFLGGLAIGSFFIGRIAAKQARPLRLYAALEAATGILALCITAVLRHASGIGAALGAPGGGPTAVRVILTFVLILPPTIVMGGTLPVLTRFVARELPKVGRHFGVLYGVNTFGAAVGCAVTGFWLIGRFGLWTTACIAAGVNLVVAGGAAMLSRDATPSTPDSNTSTSTTDLLDASKRRVLVGAFAIAGFVSISYEVLWFRVLGFFLPSTAYAFTTLLATFLVGLVIGSAIYATRLGGRVRDLSTFVNAEILLAWLGLLSMVLLGHSHGLRAKLAVALSRQAAVGIVGTGFSSAKVSDALLLSFVPAALVMLVPTIVIGVIFPCVVQLTTRHVATASRDVGVLYAVNTIGGIAGSLFTGFVAIPLFGTQATFLLMSLLSAALAIAVMRVDELASRRERIRVWAAAAMLVPAMRIVPFDWIRQSFSNVSSGRPLRIVEGRDGLMSVFEYDRTSFCESHACSETCKNDNWSHRQIRFASVSYASTSPSGRRYMAELAHLPMLTHESGAKDALVVCFGTGTTAGSFTRYPSLESLTIVDVNPDVVEAAPLFAKSNYGVADDPRVRIVIDDGRHFLTSSTKRFDVISFEPPPPTSAGVVSLYTREFYEIIASRLAPKGILTQWIPLDSQCDAHDRMLVKSVLDVFANVALFIPCGHEGIVIASNAPLVLDPARAKERTSEPTVMNALREVGLEDPAMIAGTFVAGRAELDRWANGYDAVTDDLPAVEYFFQRSDGPFDVDKLLAPRADLSSFLHDADLLAKSEPHRDVNRLLLDAHRASNVPDPVRAESLAADAARADDTAYTRYERDVEYGCFAGQR